MAALDSLLDLDAEEGENTRVALEQIVKASGAQIFHLVCAFLDLGSTEATELLLDLFVHLVLLGQGLLAFILSISYILLQPFELSIIGLLGSGRALQLLMLLLQLFELG